MESWKTEEVQEHKLNKNYKKRKGTVMFPSSHDITPKHADLAIGVLEKLFKAKNDVLIVSKPHLEVIEKLCNHFPEYKEQILFRFTIGSQDNDVLKFWELIDQQLQVLMIKIKKACPLWWAFSFKAGLKNAFVVEPEIA